MHQLEASPSSPARNRLMHTRIYPKREVHSGSSRWYSRHESVMVNRLAKIVDERHTRRVSLQTCSVLSSRTWSSAEAPTADDSDASSTCTLVNSSAALAPRRQYALWLPDAVHGFVQLCRTQPHRNQIYISATRSLPYTDFSGRMTVRGMLGVQPATHVGLSHRYHPSEQFQHVSLRGERNRALVILSNECGIASLHER
jgi:hypothetical protein